MKTYLITIPDKAENLFLRLFRKFHIKTRELSDAEYEKKVMHQLIKESESSKDVSEDEVRKYFRNY